MHNTMTIRVADAIASIDAREKDAVLKMARAAIAAMRDPTEAMDAAGQGILEDPEIASDDKTIFPLDGDAEAVWQAMIDAALAEGE